MSAEVDAVVPCHSEAFDAETVARLDPRTRIVANHSVGVDHCDLEALGERGIVVTNTPDVLSAATAEIALLLMLGAARRAVEGDRIVRSGGWDSWSPAFMVGTQVSQAARLGIVGMGRVGQAFAGFARGLGMDVHYHNRSRLDPGRENGATFHGSLDTLLPEVHLPLPALPGHTRDASSRRRRLPRGAAGRSDPRQHGKGCPRRRGGAAASDSSPASSPRPVSTASRRNPVATPPSPPTTTSSCCRTSAARRGRRVTRWAFGRSTTSMRSSRGASRGTGWSETRLPARRRAVSAGSGRRTRGGRGARAPPCLRGRIPVQPLADLRERRPGSFRCG